MHRDERNMSFLLNLQVFIFYFLSFKVWPFLDIMYGFDVTSPCHLKDWILQIHTKVP